MEADKVLHTFKPNSKFENALTQLSVPLCGAWIDTNGIDGNKLYAIACCITYWLDSMGHSDAFKTKLKTLIGILSHYGHNHEETAIHSVKICKLPFRYILATTQQLGKIHSRCFIWGTLWYKHFKRPDDIQKEDAAEPKAVRTSPAGLSSRVDVPIALSSYRLQIAKFERRR